MILARSLSPPAGYSFTHSLAAFTFITDSCYHFSLGSSLSTCLSFPPHYLGFFLPSLSCRVVSLFVSFDACICLSPVQSCLEAYL